VPVDVAVEEPLYALLGGMMLLGSQKSSTHHARVVGLEADHKVTLWLDHERVAPHRGRWEGGVVVRVPESGILLAAPDSLEVVAYRDNSVSYSFWRIKAAV